MRNRQELRNYRRKAVEAQAMLEAVESLPRRIGSLIQWGAPNGVIWRRIGDDAWVPLHVSAGYQPDDRYGAFSSGHVATTSQGWTQIKQLPSVETP